MNATTTAEAVRRSDALTRAGNRLETAALAMRAWQPSGDDDADDKSYGALESEMDDARRVFRALIEITTGAKWADVERWAGVA